jgi:hypothetical protein
MIISEMNVKLTASTSGFAKAMDKASDKIKKWRKGAAKIGPILGKVGGALKGMASMAVAAGAALAGIAWGAKKIFDLGSSIDETGSKFDTVFGPAAAAEVSAFLDNFAAKAGLTTNEAKALVSTTGAIAQGLGFGQKESGKFATEITKLAADLSSFNNLPTEQVLMGINSALTGEREQMKQLGVVILEADVQAKAFAMTGKEVAKSLTQQEKATATLALITEKAGVAVGDLERTQGSAANVAKRLMTRFRELRDAVSKALMPAFKLLLGRLEKNEQKFIDMKKQIADNTMVISLWAIAFVQSLAFVGQAIVGPIRMIANLVTAMITLEQVRRAYKDPREWGTMGEKIASVKKDLVDFKNAYMGMAISYEAFGVAMKNAMAGTSEEMQKIIDQFGVLGGGGPGGGGDGGGGPLGPIIKAAETLDKKLKDLTETFSKNFVNRMVDAAQGGKDAFSGYFAYMKKQLLALAMKALVFRAIMGLGKAWGIDMDKVGKFATSMTSISPATGGGDTGDTGAGTPILSGRAANASPRGVIVNQNINFSVSAIDGRDAARFIQEQGGAIAGIIATAAKDSTAYRRQLQGA